MSRLTRKLLVQITLTLCVVFLLSFAVNTYLLPKYFLYEKKHKLDELVTELKPMDLKVLSGQMSAIEEHHQVTIVVSSLSESVDDLNSDLLTQLGRKGITLSKFWLTEDSVRILREGGRVNKIFDQAKLKSSFLVNFMSVDGSVIAIGESISHSADTIGIVNRFNAYLWIAMFLLLVLLSVLYTKRIVKPLADLMQTAESISNLTFSRSNIQTGDEIESLARSINQMSDNLREAHQTLEAKNANLRHFISDISHELKTPLALIHVYASGLQDGLDDGTYASVIRKQSEDMAGLIDRLLELARLQEETLLFEPLAFQSLLQDTMAAYHTAFRQMGLELRVDMAVKEEMWVMADRGKLESVLNNWITNAMTYTSSDYVSIKVETIENAVRFQISNPTQHTKEADWARVWEPFYVLESSRSKKFSGTGLGLSITRAILQQHNASFGLTVEEGMVTFYFVMAVL
ncbi:two-component sensor histidine kinase [Paenibacillus pectinilyticus]|uniref:histidine kinase n=1 Tax=Paenibacillus pectinilyticus TaxID=512399 RepID=A0A1C0ZUT3_9BACL|nr:HAMP domain-containing sensor histidine kinase [Paenibacillus pectinilyticus]OCT11865.1 two-component sensor histidine kinase [Paenibacillus pectinilyticus]